MIYLMQHGEALSKEEDPDRPLTERGHRDAQNLARLLRAAGVEIDDIFHSGKPRARQTAEALAHELAPERVPERVPEAMEGLGATDPVEVVARNATTWARNVALVSHMPFVARLAGALVNGDEEQAPAAFVPGTMVALECDDGNWRIAWMIRPELLDH